MLLNWGVLICLTTSMLRTTGVPTLFNAGYKQNVIPELAHANINYRLFPGEDRDSILNHVKPILKNPNIQLEVNDASEAPPFSSTDSIGYKTLTRVINDLTNHSVAIAPVLTVGGTDGRHFRHLTNDLYQFLFISGTIDDFKGYHGLNEKISIENFVNSIRFYHRLIKA